MRFPLGFNILLVLIVSLVCISTIGSAYYNQDGATREVETTLGLSAGGPNQAQLDNITDSAKESGLVSGTDEKLLDQPVQQPLQPTKRQGMGMPTSNAASQGVSGSDLVLDAGDSGSSGLSEGLNQPLHQQESGARGLFSAQQPSQIPNQQPQPLVPDQLPKIYEGNQLAYPPAQSQQQQSQQQQSQIDQQNNIQLQSQSPQQPPMAAPQIGGPQPTDLMAPPGNMSMPGMSTARTFDSWTSCVGSSSYKHGTCKNDVECNKYKGKADGSCMGGLGVCCVMALSCNDKSIENNTFWANPDFPEPSWEARLCEVEIKKKSLNILQVMIEFEEFELAPPNYDGECVTDVFTVKLASNKPSPYSLLRICGQNTGQHMYLDVSQLDEPLVLSIATSGGGYPRRWSIRIVQMDDKNFLLAPPGCLQYYTDTVGHFRSFNLGRNLKNLYYAICFRIDNGYSGIRFTENFFGMNGPQCKRRVTGGYGGRGQIEAHPHHLVIPPPGYAQPLPRPKFQQQGPYPPPPMQGGPLVLPPQGRFKGPGRFKRQIDYMDQVNERVQRTHPSEHGFEHEHEKFKNFEKESYPQAYYGQGYKAPQEGYGPAPSYGPPAPQPGYSQQPPPAIGGYGPPPPPPPPSYGYQPEYPMYQEPYKKEEIKHDHEHEHEHEHNTKGWSLGSSFNWGFGKSTVKKDAELEKSGHHPHHSHHHQQQPYGPQYGYQPAGGYGPPGYGPPGYGPPPAYGGGSYHHKDIEKFGQKYEHLEHKHEKNHHKEHEKAVGGSWWPSWGSSKSIKKDDKKEKYFQHHEALFPMIRIPEMPHCEPRFCGQNDVITFPPSGDSISEMCGNRFNRGHGPKIISGSPLVIYVSNKGHQRGAGFDMNYEQVFYIPKPY